MSVTSRPGIVTVKAAHPSDEDAGLTRNPSTIQPPGPRVPGDQDLFGVAAIKPTAPLWDTAWGSKLLSA